MPDLLVKCCTGEHIPEAKLEQVKVGRHKLVFLKVTMSDADLERSARWFGDIPERIWFRSTSPRSRSVRLKTSRAGRDGGVTTGSF